KWAEIPLASISDVTNGAITMADYLSFVDQTGRVMREGKGSISPGLDSILTRLGIDARQWPESSKSIGRDFRRVIGPVQFLRTTAERAGKRWMQGASAAERIFCAARGV